MDCVFAFVPLRALFVCVRGRARWFRDACLFCFCGLANRFDGLVLLVAQVFSWPCEAAAEQWHLWQATLGVAVACLPASAIQHLTELYLDKFCRMLASQGVPFDVAIVKTLTENAPMLHPVLFDVLTWRSLFHNALFLLCIVTFFLNLLIAKLVSANKRINSQKVGLARLSRMEIIIETLRTVTKKRWERFVDTRCSWTRICEAAAEQLHLWQATLGVAVACLPASTIQHLTELYRDELCRMLASQGVPFRVAIVKTLTENAPVLHPVLPDGLICCSRLNQDGVRRVNYNIKPLLLTQNGKFAATVKNLCDNADPGMVCHPVNLVVFSNRVSAFVLVCGRMLGEVGATNPRALRRHQNNGLLRQRAVPRHPGLAEHHRRRPQAPGDFAGQEQRP